MLNKVQPQILGFIGLSVLLSTLARASESQLHLFSFIRLNQTNTFGFIFLASDISFCVNRQLSLDFALKNINLNYLIKYYLRVFFLILPLYWIVLIIMFIIYNLGIQKTGLIDNAGMLYAFMSFSELSMNFYFVHILLLYFILCPLINFLLDKITKWNFLLIIFLVLLAVVIVEFINQNVPFGKFNLMRYLSVFLISSLAAYTVNFSSLIKSLKDRNLKILNHFASLSIILIILSFKSVSEYLFKLPSSFTLQSFYIYYALLASIIILSSLYGDGILKSILKSSPLKLLGTISIGFYLIHWPALITTYNSTIVPASTKVYVYLALLFFFGLLSYFLVISPLLKVLDRSKF